METRQPQYKIGDKFMTRGKHKRECTITDILKTYNHAGELVSIRYVATHDFLGQAVTVCDVPETAIAMGRN